MAGILSLHFAVDSWAFFSSLSYAKNTEIPSYEEGISLFDVEATLQPNGVLDIKENIHFQARNQQIKHGFIVIYRDSGCSLMGRCTAELSYCWRHP